MLMQATLHPPPYSTEAFDLIEPIRAAAGEGGGRVLVGGATAVEFDVRDAAAWDSLVIPPIVLLVVFLILMLLLRAVVGLVLIGTVILSYAAALGVSYFVFDVVFGFPGSDPSLPLFGVRVPRGARRRLQHLPRRPRARGDVQARHASGMLRALAVTGGVITSAGIVLAGTFAVLGSAAAGVPDRDRLRGRVRRAARHVPRALRARPGARRC